MASLVRQWLLVGVNPRPGQRGGAGQSTGVVGSRGKPLQIANRSSQSCRGRSRARRKSPLDLPALRDLWGTQPYLESTI